MPSAERLILILLDGLRADAVPQAEMPHLNNFITSGSHTLQAQTVMPSITLPCHTSLFYAVPASEHGVTSNTWQAPPATIPSLAEVIHQAGLGTAIFYTWEELRDLSKPGTLDFAYFRRLGDWREDRMQTVAEAAADFITTHRPAFSYLYLEATDAAGHDHGWLSAPYLEAAVQADQAIGTVFQAVSEAGLLEETVFLVLADHGGHDYGHGTDMPEDLTIPWIVSGPGVKRGYQLTGEVSIIDTAPTILHLLGLAIPSTWQGRVISEIFEAPADRA